MRQKRRRAVRGARVEPSATAHFFNPSHTLLRLRALLRAEAEAGAEALEDRALARPLPGEHLALVVGRVRL